MAEAGGAMAGNEDDDATVNQLVIENERLQKVFEKLNSRQSVLEEFIEVEYGDKFNAFLKNRERLVNVMGLDDSGQTDKIDGNRSAKSLELSNLLKVVKQQAAAEDPSTSAGERPQQSRNPPYNPHKKWKKFGGRGRGNRRH